MDRIKHTLVFLLAFSVSAFAANAMRVYVGTYTGGVSEGIYLLDFNSETGVLDNKRLACKTENPSFLAQHPQLPVIYAVGEMDGGGKVSAFTIEADSGLLTPLNNVSAGGAGPCHVTVAADGKHLAVANYGGGSVAVFELGEDGALGERTAFMQHSGASADPRRQEGPHAHAVDFDPSGQFLLCADLGLDKVLVYRIDKKTGVLTPNDAPFIELPPGVGPRQIAFHPNGKRLFVVNEMGNTVSTFQWDADTGKGSLLGHAPTLPADYAGASHAAEIAAHPSGDYVYASNRGYDSIAVFGAAAQGGNLKPLGFAPLAGKTPRHFSLDPTGEWLLAALQNSGKISVLRVEAETGLLSDTDSVAEVGNPVCVLFARD